ncbi:MAG: hypothetical protein GTO55_02205 [Armatimonadetes bacterium]|nr:hypothetical protein [Armatimonadota bacterium]NIM23091.1 hypothetical protein [Armatimonadota bacterium]NIM66959.1 hypothetical protein [Armatimonadota bacterium]NIM75493.1 hypothetical protein [Armatimonadota bacterium]NIN05150.1 hypothetical protein [Armatimonadota bacterium]
MKCEDVRERLVDYLDGEISPEERAEIGAHVKACADCAKEAKELSCAEEALHTLKKVETAPDLIADLHRRLEGVRKPRLVWRWAGVSLAAATAAAAVLLWTHPWSAPPTPSQQPPPVAIKPQPETGPAPVVPAEKEVVPQPSEPAGRRIAQRPAVKTVSKSVLPKATQLTVAEQPVLEATSPEIDAPPVEFAEAEEPIIRDGVIVLLGEPEAPAPSSSYFAEVTLPNGGKSVMEHVVERDENGQPHTIRVAYRKTPPQDKNHNQGG